MLMMDTQPGLSRDELIFPFFFEEEKEEEEENKSRPFAELVLLVLWRRIDKYMCNSSGGPERTTKLVP